MYFEKILSITTFFSLRNNAIVINCIIQNQFSPSLQPKQSNYSLPSCFYYKVLKIYCHKKTFLEKIYSSQSRQSVKNCIKEFILNQNLLKLIAPKCQKLCQRIYSKRKITKSNCVSVKNLFLTN
jgi:hypothetical protein